MTQPKTTRIPAPLYAAAGAGELAYQQLRKLPTVVTDLGGKAVSSTVELADKVAATLRTANTTAAGLREKAVPADLDLDRLREVAVRNAAVVVAGAQAAQEQALAVYGALITRGERVVGSGVVQAADTVNSDIEVTEAEFAAAPVGTETEVTATPATVAEVVESKPKATRARAVRKPATVAVDTPSAKLPTKNTRSAAK